MIWRKTDILQVTVFNWSLTIYKKGGTEIVGTRRRSSDGRTRAASVGAVIQT